MLIMTITPKIAPILNRCQDADISGFRRPLDKRIFAIKDLSKIECDSEHDTERDILRRHSFAIILADENGKQNGKYVAISCPSGFLETEIMCLLRELDQVESIP